MTAHPRSDVRRTLRAGIAVVLGSVALKGLFTDYGWLIDIALTVGVVLGPAMLIRLRRPAGALDIWPGVLLLIPWLTLRFVPGHAHAGFVPAHATLDDVSSMITRLHQISQHEVAPIQSTPEVRLVLCALVGLLAALIDLVAVVGRRGALAAIPLLVIYTVSGAVPRRAVAWPWFVVAACGFLLLLSLDAADDRANWGRRLAAGHPDRARDNAAGSILSRSAFRVGVIAIAIAILVPIVVPVPSTNLLADAFRSGKGQPGFGARSGSGGSISPFALLRGQLNRGRPSDIAKVRILDRGNPVVAFYLRVNVLDKFSLADGWSEGDHGSTEPIQRTDLQTEPENDQPRSDQFTAEITIDGLTGNAPLFAAATRINGLAAGARWSPKDQLLLEGSVSRGQKIVEVVNQPAPTLAQLRAAPSGGPDVSQWLVKPALPASVTSLVDRLIAGAASPYDRARAISNYFADPASGFAYSTRTSGADSGNALVDFLKYKQGYCQQFAAAMAIMLREAGVPSRVVLGYEHQPGNAKGEFTVTTDDAHAWVEAYFAGLGWIPFDPTPPGGLTGGPQSDLPWAPHNYGPGAQGGAEPGLNKPGQASTHPAGPSGTTAPPPSDAEAAPPGGTSAPWPALGTALVVLLVLALAMIPAAVRRLRRTRRMGAARGGDADAVWAELADTALDLGYGWSHARSPRQVATWLARALGRPAAVLDELAGMVEKQRFGPATEGGHSDLRELIVGVRQVLGELRRMRSVRTRVAATLWPRSLGWRLHRPAWRGLRTGGPEPAAVARRH